jgi:glycine hydroxymethyltransferase
MIAEVLDGLARKNGEENNARSSAAVNERVRELCARFPIYQG